jgi:RNA polymerase-interacting CarD/CdnL/TRCF family regulator
MEADMTFQVGDQVVHWTYGPGEVIQLDEKALSGQTEQYYVVQIRDMTLFVPINDQVPTSLRLPTPADEFESLFTILRSPAEPLSGDRWERKNQLTARMKDGRLESICQVIRDLIDFRQLKKLNDYDSAILDRAENFLVNEWQISLGVTRAQAEKELRVLLGEKP